MACTINVTFGILAATMFEPLSVVHGTLSASSPASLRILSKVIWIWLAVFLSGKNLQAYIPCLRAHCLLSGPVSCIQKKVTSRYEC